MHLDIEDRKAFSSTPRWLAYAEKSSVKKIIDEGLENEIIRASESEYASPNVLIRKKTGGLRMCLDQGSAASAALHSV